MTLPFGVAIYPDCGKKSTLDPLPRITLTRTHHESVAGRVERSDGQLVQLAPRRRQSGRDTYHYASDAAPEVRSLRGAPGRETASVRRRPTTVRRDIADAVMLAVLNRRNTVARSNLARSVGVTQRELHLAELGCVQPGALPAIAGYFGVDLRAYTDQA